MWYGGFLLSILICLWPAGTVQAQTYRLIEFEDIALGNTFPAANQSSTIISSGESMHVESIAMVTGSQSAPAFYQAEISQYRLPAHFLSLTNAALVLDLPSAVQTLSLAYTGDSTEVVVRINGEVRVLNSIQELDGETVAGVQISAPDQVHSGWLFYYWTGGHIRGGAVGMGGGRRLVLTGTISDFAIGADAIAVDNIALNPINGGFSSITPVYPAAIGVSRDGRYFYVDTTRNDSWDGLADGDGFYDFGIRSLEGSAKPISGLWVDPFAGTPVIGTFSLRFPDMLGLYNAGYFYLDANGTGVWDGVAGGDIFYDFGLRAIDDTATPIIGDWDGDGVDNIGLYNAGYFYLDRNGNGRWDGVAGGDTFYDFGIRAIDATAQPVIGDWNGDKIDTVGLYNAGYFYLDANSNGRWDGVAGGDTFYDYGIRSIATSATPVVGNWDGLGGDDLGLFNERYFYLDLNSNGRWDSVNGGDYFADYGLSGTPLTGVLGSYGVQPDPPTNPCGDRHCQK